MKSVIRILDEKISDAMCTVTGRQDCSAMVTAAKDAKFGDYQANGVMALAKQLKTNPRELAQKVLDNLKLDDICQQPEIAGPGFINLRLKPDFIADRLLEISKDDQRLGIEKASSPKTVVVDFSGPNIAKQMHVGHLRSTIIGDCICRLYKFLGHNVIPQNHIGDWGTQFGMLIAYLKTENPKAFENSLCAHISNLEEFYRTAKAKCDENADFAESARKEVKKLHDHDKKTLEIWQHIVDESRNHYLPIYGILGVQLTKENERGESFYKDMLADVVSDLQKAGIAEESDGAICVFPEGFKNKQGDPLPFIIRKSDGAFLYATTDLAAIRYRINELKADKIIYVTDSRQKLHFDMLFAVAKMAGWLNDDVKPDHIMFGSVLGEDGKPLKTRSGENVKLKELLDEAVERAKAVVEEKNPDFSGDKKTQIAKAIGIGAVKYADYSNNRTSDYLFSFDKMLAMDGNTAPYMQYAYARIKSIERKADSNSINVSAELKGIKKLALNEPAELELAKHLIRFDRAIATAAAEYRPNYLTIYLYELAQKFSGFYNECPVLKAGQDKRPARLLLCHLTAETIKYGLDKLLGIELVEQM